jgi:fructose-bisphosphate aldolase class II
MPLISMRQILDQAARGGYGVAAFNICNMEQAQAIFEAALKTRSPVIVQINRGARGYTYDAYLVHLVQASLEIFPDVLAALNLDHGVSPASCQAAIGMGFTSVMIDGSLLEDGRTPSSFDYNVRVTREVIEFAHARGVTVEAELGCLGGIEDGHGAGIDPASHLTDPDQAVEFVRLTGVDALAVAIGTSHGAYKFSKKPTGHTLVMERVQAIHQRLPETHLVMHGSSSVPQELQDAINAHGGRIQQTYGVPIEEIQFGIRNGVRKINVDTDNRMAMTAAVREHLARHPQDFDPRAYLKPAREAMKEVVKARMIAFGQAGHAADYAPIPLDEMARRYPNA